MAKNLYVGNLAFAVTSDDLYELFLTHGKVALAQVITDHGTGRSRGFGFVEMADDQGAQQAIAALHGAEFQGRPLTVHEARPRGSRPVRP
jgi:RNA recognition motif-containing protein